MSWKKLKIFKILLYKNFLVQKRQWVLCVEFLITFVMFIILWRVKSAYTGTQIFENPIVSNKTHGIQFAIDYFDREKNYLLIVPDNQFTRKLTEYMRNCYPGEIFMYNKVDDMTNDYLTNWNKASTLALIFDDENINETTQNFKYKIQTDSLISELTFRREAFTDVFQKSFTGLQLCLDKSLIVIKKNDPTFVLDINTFKMPTSSEEYGLSSNTAVCAIAVATLLIPLCLETYYSSMEKFTGVNVLMSLNRVPNYLNLLSWLVSGIISSFFYIIPIVLIMSFATSEDYYSFLEYGNPIILWLMLTLNISHLIAFGMHITAYFTKSLYMMTGLIVVYVGSMIFVKFGVNVEFYQVISYFGIIFPSVLVFRAFEEICFYEDIKKGIHFSNLFQVSNQAYGLEGSLGFMMLFSIFGIILHMLLANYVYAVNPGKYGVKKDLLYFLQCFKKRTHVINYDTIENIEYNDVNGKTFEPVTETTRNPTIQIRNLKKTYDKLNIRALQGISVDFYRGHITALLGHSGSGKTTMMSILSGKISPSEGSVFINEKNVNGQMDEIINDVGLCFEEILLFPHVSVAEQVKLFAMLKNEDESLSLIESDVNQLLTQLKLFNKRNALPKQLSVGEKRRVCLALALIGDSNTLILDEPTLGLDPVNKRNVWNTLLSIKKHKTILITTRNMEEAEILGNRIAILHNGQLKCYATPTYLKQLLGYENIEVTLTIEPTCDTEYIVDNLDHDTELISYDNEKIVLKIPDNNELADKLDDIEQYKKDLGIKSICVSRNTLEDLFVEATLEYDDPLQFHQPFAESTAEFESAQQVLRTCIALLSKKLTCTFKNPSTTLIPIFMLSAGLVCIIWILKDDRSVQQALAINLNMYRDTKNYYNIRQFSKPFANSYAHLIADLGGQSREITGSSNFNEQLLRILRKDTKTYDHNNFMAASFLSNEDHNRVHATAMYNSRLARFAAPISINLVSNAILRSVTDINHSIEVSIQEFARDADRNVKFNATIKSYLAAVVLAFVIYPIIVLFVVHPIVESQMKLKHLQRMTGVSCLNYWGTIFAFDFMLFLAMTMTIILGIVVGDYFVDIRIFTTTEFYIELGLFVLFAVNVLPLSYIFSFWKRSKNSAIKLFKFLPLAIIIIDFTMSITRFYLIDTTSHEDSSFFSYRKLQKTLFLFTPYASFFEGQIALFNKSLINAECVKIADHVDFNITCRNEGYKLRICCDMKCNEESCSEAVSHFNDFSNDISLSASFLSLSLTSVLYFSILLIFELKTLNKFMIKYHKFMSNNNKDEATDQQVKKVKEEIVTKLSKLRIGDDASGEYQSAIDDEIQDMDEYLENPRQHELIVHELRKIYRKFTVHNVSFAVQGGQCFGILGINGSGKSTTIKMITDEVIRNNGSVHLINKDSLRVNNHLKQIGYCPQNHAIIDSLNVYDHLRLFGRLRGIPKDELEQEVKNWIDRLSLNVCDSQPAGIFSAGNKRKLNIAMALIGVPNLVILDEPTAGVDPATRSSLWNTIQSCKSSGQTVIVTSKSMEECKVLCDKLAIMANGKLVAIGSPEELKKRFGNGYDVHLMLSPKSPINQVIEMKLILINTLQAKLVMETAGSLSYHVTAPGITWRRMYDVLNLLKENCNSIEDFTVVTSTLQQLFLKFTQTAGKPKNFYDF